MWEYLRNRFDKHTSPGLLAPNTCIFYWITGRYLLKKSEHKKAYKKQVQMEEIN